MKTDSELMLRALMVLYLYAVVPAFAASGGPGTAPVPLPVEPLTVTSGDALEVRGGAETLRVRIANINAPVPGQPGFARARNTLAKIVQGQSLTITAVPDQPGRYTVKRNAEDVASLMVKRGLAWVDRASVANGELYALEGKARAAKRGLWHTDWPISPPEWQTGKRHARNSEADLSGLVIADKRSRTFFAGACSIPRIPDEDVALFARPRDAIANGYKPKKSCN